jgi:hypothetical protein
MNGGKSFATCSLKKKVAGRPRRLDASPSSFSSGDMRSERQSGQQRLGDGETIPRRETEVNPADLDVDLAQGRIKPQMRLFKTGVNSVNTF